MFVVNLRQLMVDYVLAAIEQLVVVIFIKLEPGKNSKTCGFAKDA